MKLEALDPKDPLLRKICQQVSRQELKTKKFQEIVESVLDFTYEKSNKGPQRDRNKHTTVGLSANQVGVDKQISVVDLAIGKKEITDMHIIINPAITWKSKTKTNRCEGCVNLPHIWGYVERSARVRVKAMDRSGNLIQIDAKGWPAILLQHEIDHLNGYLFIDKLPDPKKALLVKEGEFKTFNKEKKNWTQYIDVSDLIKK